MTPKIVLVSITLSAAATAALLLSASGLAEDRSSVWRAPLNEEQHALVLESVFGGADVGVAANAIAGVDAPAPENALAAQGSSSAAAAQGTPLDAERASVIDDLSWRRIDTFGIRQTWGYLNPHHTSTSPIAMVFDTVVVPPAYAHCLRQYETVTDVEVRLTPIGGGVPTVIRSTLLPGNSAVSVVVPAALWRSTQSARILAWTSTGNPGVDGEAISDQELTP